MNSVKKKKVEATMMYEIMVDTDILIDLSRSVSGCMNFFDGLSAEATIFISVISKMEILTGCRNKSEQEIAENFLDDFVVLPIEADVSLAACDLYATFHLSHGVSILDCLIASTAIGRKIEFYTRNKKHFDVFPDIRLRVPY